MAGRSILIPMTMVVHSLEGARSAGMDIDRLLAQCDITPTQLHQPNARVPVDQFARLNRHISSVMNDEMYGLLAKPVPLGATQVMSFNMVHAKTVGGAFKRFLEFNHLFENSLAYSLVAKGEQAELVLQRRPGWKILNSFAIESSLAFPHRFVGWLANERIVLNQVQLDYEPPAYSREYRQIFYGAPCLFRQQKICIQFDRGYLNHPIVQTEASLESYLRRLPMDNYLPLDACGKTTVDVRNRVNAIFRETGELPDFEDVADNMGCHPQALRRRLKTEGTHYRAIRTQIRRDIAMHHLGVGDLSVEDIAYKTGYTEPSAFIRAFKSWTGLTPLSFRNGLTP